MMECLTIMMWMDNRTFATYSSLPALRFERRLPGDCLGDLLGDVSEIID